MGGLIAGGMFFFLVSGLVVGLFLILFGSIVYFLFGKKNNKTEKKESFFDINMENIKDKKRFVKRDDKDAIDVEVL